MLVLKLRVTAEWDQTSNDTSGAATIDVAAAFRASFEGLGESSSSLEAYSVPRSAMLWGV